MNKCAGLRASAPLTAQAKAKDCMGKYAAEMTLIKVMVRGCIALGYQNSPWCGIPPINDRCEGWHSIWCALTQQKVLFVWPCCLLLIKVCKLSTDMCVRWARLAVRVRATVYHVSLGKAFVWIARLIGTDCSEWEWQRAAFLMWPSSVHMLVHLEVKQTSWWVRGPGITSSHICAHMARSSLYVGP